MTSCKHDERYISVELCVLKISTGQIMVQVLPSSLLQCHCVLLNNAKWPENVLNYSSWKRNAVKLNSSIVASLCYRFVFVAELMPTAV